MSQKQKLLLMIADAYSRMATNTDCDYRETQMKKVDEWLAQLTDIFEKDPVAWMNEAHTEMLLL